MVGKRPDEGELRSLPVSGRSAGLGARASVRSRRDGPRRVHAVHVAAGGVSCVALLNALLRAAVQGIGRASWRRGPLPLVTPERCDSVRGSVARLLLEDLAHSLPDWLLHVAARSMYSTATDRADDEPERLPTCVQQTLSLVQSARTEASRRLGGWCWWWRWRIHDMAAECAAHGCEPLLMRSDQNGRDQRRRQRGWRPLTEHWSTETSGDRKSFA
jgi:hypothetical protein